MEKSILSKRVQGIETSATVAIDSKAKEMKRQGIKVLNFGAGEPDFATPTNIKEGGIRAIQSDQTKYTPVKGTQELLEAICQKFKKDNDLDYIPEEIIVSNGAKQIIFEAIQSICDPGDEIILPAPYWVSYSEQVKLAGGKPVIVKQDGFRLPLQEIERAVNEKTKAIIINSPNNPTGVVFNRAEIEGLAKIVIRCGILVITDEVYEKLLFGNAKHFSFAALNPELKNLTITVNGVSKTYAMTGWRIGYAGGPKEIIQAMAKLQSHVSGNPCSVAQAASVEALSGNQEAIQEMVAAYDERRKYLCNELSEVGVEFIQPEGAFYIFFKVAPKFDSMQFCERMLEEHKVALVPGDAFGVSGWTRLSYATNLGDIKEGIKRIRREIEN